MLNGIAQCRAITTRANRKLQVDALKKALGLNHVRDSDDTRDNNNDDFNSSSSNCDFNLTRGNSANNNGSSSNRNSNPSNHNSNCNNNKNKYSTKGLPGEKA